MSNISYPTKTVAGNGTPAYVEGRSLPATELQGDFDEIANKVNGQLDEDNLKAGTQIENSKLVDIDAAKVTDHAETAAVFATKTSPGDTETPTLPTTLEGEINALRYMAASRSGYLASGLVQYFNASAVLTDASWTEPPMRGPNLIANAGFEDTGVVSGDPPSLWTEVGTIAASSTATGAAAKFGKSRRHFILTNTVADSGISQLLSGLKSSTKYLFGMNYTITSGAVEFFTAGGLDATNAYQDCLIADSATGSRSAQMIVKTDANARDITFTIQGTTTGDVWTVSEAWCYELSNENTSESFHIPTRTATHNTAEVVPATFTVGQWNNEEIGELGLSQYIPSEGFRLTYEVTICYTGAGTTAGTPVTPIGTTQSYSFIVLMDIDAAGDNTVDGPYMIENKHVTDNWQAGGIIALKHVVENPTPGSTYAFAVQIGAYNIVTISDQRMTLNPVRDGVQSISKARITMDRI